MHSVNPHPPLRGTLSQGERDLPPSRPKSCELIDYHAAIQSRGQSPAGFDVVDEDVP